MSKSPWGNIGAWAAEAERAEAVDREAAEKAAAASAQPPSSFPSLKDAVSTGAKQKKKNKMTLQEFTMQQSSYSGSSASRGLTVEEMMRLPTGPRVRSPEEMQYGRLGGGFSNYGTRPGSAGSNQGRGRDYEGRRSYGFQDDYRRGGPRRFPEMDEPSRADGVDNWASMKRQTVPEYNSGLARPGGKYASLGGSPGAASRADEVDNWASVKKPISQPQQPPKSANYNAGFYRPDTDRWTSNEQRLVLDPPRSEVVNKPNPFGAARPREEVLAEKGLDWKKSGSEIESKKKLSVSGGSRPGSSHSSRPDSPLSSRSEASLTPGVGDGVVNPKPKVNPFGNAKPREVLLEEKGLDWKKIDLELEHRRVERPETEEEKSLKEEIEHLKKESLKKSGDDQNSIHDLILQREQELELLTRQLDDKVHYSQRNFERPASAGGRGAGFNDRPPFQFGSYEEPRGGFLDRPPSMYEEPRAGYSEIPRARSGMYEDSIAGSMGGPYEDPRPGSYERPRSRSGTYEEPRGGFSQRSSFTSGAYEEPRVFDYSERLRSRGSGNSWSRPGDDRRHIQGGGGGGFFGSRDVDRSSSRW